MAIKIKDPVSGYSHLAGFILFSIGTVALALKASGALQMAHSYFRNFSGFVVRSKRLLPFIRGGGGKSRFDKKIGPCFYLYTDRRNIHAFLPDTYERGFARCPFCADMGFSLRRYRRSFFPEVLEICAAPGVYRPLPVDGLGWRDADLSVKKVPFGSCAVGGRRNFLFHRRRHLRAQEAQFKRQGRFPRTFSFFCASGNSFPFLLHLPLRGPGPDTLSNRAGILGRRELGKFGEKPFMVYSQGAV